MPPAVLAPESPSFDAAVAPPQAPSRREVLTWSLAASGLLTASGLLRVAIGRTAQLGDLKAVAPFPLDSIPESINGWKVVPDFGDSHLDPVTTRITGSTSHVIRMYYDETTGTTVSVLILYGPAEPVLPHTPQVCYPANGYRSVRNPIDRPIAVSNLRDVQFRSALFAKSGGRVMIRQSVYHSYRLDGVWSPNVTDRRLPRRQAGLFKVQAYRQILDAERGDFDEPIENFLQQLVPAIELRIAQSVPAASTPSQSSQT